ncbi:MAG: hypothetical protein R2784_02405 [Saprospiraceae bacterium]
MKNLTRFLLFAFCLSKFNLNCAGNLYGTITYAIKVDGAEVEMFKSMMPEKMVIGYSERGIIIENLGGSMAVTSGKIVIDNKHKKYLSYGKF